MAQGQVCFLLGPLFLWIFGALLEQKCFGNKAGDIQIFFGGGMLWTLSNTSFFIFKAFILVFAFRRGRGFLSSSPHIFIKTS